MLRHFRYRRLPARPPRLRIPCTLDRRARMGVVSLTDIPPPTSPPLRSGLNPSRRRESAEAAGTPRVPNPRTQAWSDHAPRERDSSSKPAISAGFRPMKRESTNPMAVATNRDYSKSDALLLAPCLPSRVKASLTSPFPNVTRPLPRRRVLPPCDDSFPHEECLYAAESVNRTLEGSPVRIPGQSTYSRKAQRRGTRAENLRQ